jgi:hypothetical protein
MGFHSLQHMRARRSTYRGVCRAPLRSALRVWLPSRRFTPSSARAGLLACRQRSWDSPFGAFSSRKVSAASPRGSTHVPFSPSVAPAPPRWAGPTDRGFWAFTLSRVPGDRHGFRAATAGCSLGLCPLRVSGSRHRTGRPVLLPRAWTRRHAVGLSPRLGVFEDLNRASSATGRNRHGGDNPSRVLAPGQARAFEREPFGLSFHLTLCRASLPTASAP